MILIQVDQFNLLIFNLQKFNLIHENLIQFDQILIRWKVQILDLIPYSIRRFTQILDFPY